MYLIFEPNYYTFTSLKFKGHPGSKNEQCVIVAKVSILRSYSVIISLWDISHSFTEFHFCTAILYVFEVISNMESSVQYIAERKTFSDRCCVVQSAKPICLTEIHRLCCVTKLSALLKKLQNSIQNCQNMTLWSEEWNWFTRKPSHRELTQLG